MTFVTFSKLVLSTSGSLGAAGLVAMVVRDALGRLLMGLVHG